jgi:RNA polymerase sigma-70 factor (ECF subfamily)
MVTTALNFLKKHSRYRTDLSYDNNDALHPVVENDAEVNMTARELAELIRQLPTGYQTIFNLHAVEGFTHVEIGSMLGISDGTSRSQYARARSLLISWVEKKSQIKNDHYAG